MKNVSLMLVSSALLAFGAGAVQAGQAAPQQSQPSQQPPAQQQQMPAPQPASADQVAKCDKVANSIMTSLKNKDFNGATSNFNDELKPMLPADKLEEGWNSLVSKFGQPQNIGHASGGQQIQDYTVVLLPMQFEKGRMGAQVACSSQGKVASLRIGQMQDDGGQAGGGGASSKS